MKLGTIYRKSTLKNKDRQIFPNKMPRILSSSVFMPLPETGA
jgi:hypothetical protein